MTDAPTSGSRPAVAVGVAVAAVLAVVLALLVAGLVAGGDEPAPRTAPPVPVETPTAATPTPEPAAGPVLLLPGYGGSTGVLSTLADRLGAEGREVRVVRLPDAAQGDIRDQAASLDAAVQEELAAGAPSVDVVGYSAGGVVARVWASELGGAEVARRIVTLGAPHHGTELAARGLAETPQQCPTACRQLVPDSELLASLGPDETPAGPEWVSVWTDRDRVVTPPASARLDGAVNVQTQAVCADATVDHGTLPTDPLVVGIVVAALTEEELRPVDAGDCTALREVGAAA